MGIYASFKVLWEGVVAAVVVTLVVEEEVDKDGIGTSEIGAMAAPRTEDEDVQEEATGGGEEQ